jgi:predicted membrane-bound spermidine synthase
MALPGLQAGILVAGLAILTPPLLLFGVVSPLVIQLLSQDSDGNAGKATGMVYAISTVGGVVATFAFAFYLIPFWGLNAANLLISGLLFAAFLCSRTSFFASFTSKAK